MPIREVRRQWDDRYGNCIDCGDPAAYLAPDIYVNSETGRGPITDNNLFCGVCAALHASEGQRIVYLFPTDAEEAGAEQVIALPVSMAETILARADYEQQSGRLDDEDKTVLDHIERELEIQRKRKEGQ